MGTNGRAEAGTTNCASSCGNHAADEALLAVASIGRARELFPLWSLDDRGDSVSRMYGTRVLVAAAAACVTAVAAAFGGAGAPAPTFYGQVDRILRRHCDECHHEGDIGPMALDDYATARQYADGILEEIDAGRMPPWRPTRGVGQFVGERRLGAREIATLRRWRDAGAPEGPRPAKDRPVSYPSGFLLGTPDGVLDYGEPFVVPANAQDIYRCLPIRNPFGHDVWISGIDVVPGDRRVLHHIVMYVDSTNGAAQRDAAEDGPGYSCFGGPGTAATAVLGGWAPGNRPGRFPRGTAMRLRANQTVVLQCHYHPIDVDVADRTTVGLYLSPEASPQEVFLLPVLNDEFTIPAGDPAYPVEANFDPALLTGGLFAPSGLVLAVMPHMHWLGKSISVDVLLPDATEQRLVEIDDWDFDWQDTYTFASPVPAPSGSKFRVRAVYDNSDGNPDNPNQPPQPVSYGERTVDEMCLAFLVVTLAPAQASPPPEVKSAAIDAKGRLVVAARSLGRGGRIEIDGTPLPDSAALGRNRVVSSAAWQSLVPETGSVSLRIRRPDGRLSLPFTFSR
jgi:copper type II ascorbate-dependent monooxygenase-like protein